MEWYPFPGPQLDFCSRGEFEVLFGGAAGRRIVWEGVSDAEAKKLESGMAWVCKCGFKAKITLEG